MLHKGDLLLAKQLAEGDEKVFKAFFRDYFPRLYRFALTRLGSDEDAIKDIVQTTLMNAMRSISTYRGEAAMFTWLCQICRNDINAHFRSLAKSVPVVPQDDVAIRPILESLAGDDQDNPDSQYEGVQMKKLVQEVLDYLPTNYGDALEWKYIEGLSVVEIAARLKITELATQSILARARKSFRAALLEISPIITIRNQRFS
ncbi:MAG: RNA polymerase sigma-70 factor (ECF subfamily) [Candidatus Azotimanducaceae bacterium]|jgi:RNA polymerase sigma-70 factor (ECF subfamily)